MALTVVLLPCLYPSKCCYKDHFLSSLLYLYHPIFVSLYWPLLNCIKHKLFHFECPSWPSPSTSIIIYPVLKGCPSALINSILRLLHTQPSWFLSVCLGEAHRKYLNKNTPLHFSRSLLRRLLCYNATNNRQQLDCLSYNTVAYPAEKYGLGVPLCVLSISICCPLIQALCGRDCLFADTEHLLEQHPAL